MDTVPTDAVNPIKILEPVNEVMAVPLKVPKAFLVILTIGIGINIPGFHGR